MFIRLLFVALFSLALIGCGRGGGDTSTQDIDGNLPEKERVTTGTPIFLFGSGDRLRGIQTEDKEYQEYLLWKEWQEYQNYLKWQRLQQEQQQKGG